MKKAQPEKYYEACITYHIVMEFKRIGIKVYPYSISQREEKEGGYDFGYHFLENSFLIQYKSPDILSEIEDGKNIYRWEIDREQLGIINRNNGNLPIYYALPAFDNIFDWYSGIQKTYFIESRRLEELFDKQTKTSVIRSNCEALRTWEFLMKKFRRMTYDYAVQVGEEEIESFKNMSEVRDGLWLYCLEK